MRRLLVTFAVLMLCLPAAGLAERRGPNAGTFSLRGGRGVFIVNARGGVIGTLARGRVIITDPLPEDGTGPIVSLSSDDWRVEHPNTNTTVYGGTNIRFRLLGGTFRIKVVGRGVSLSVVGTGKVTLNGDDTADDDGTYSFNGDPYQPVLTGPTVFALNVSTP